MNYQCGHPVKPILIKKNIVQYNLYLMWKESGSKLCFDCWNKENKEKFIQESLKILNKHRGEKHETS